MAPIKQSTLIASQNKGRRRINILQNNLQHAEGTVKINVTHSGASARIPGAQCVFPWCNSAHFELLFRRQDIIAFDDGVRISRGALDTHDGFGHHFGGDLIIRA